MGFYRSILELVVVFVCFVLLFLVVMVVEYVVGGFGGWIFVLIVFYYIDWVIEKYFVIGDKLSKFVYFLKFD